MIQQTTPSHTRCKHSTHHNEHLCYLLCEGFHLSNKEEYKDLVQNAKYFCQSCGRTAESADYLCDPIPL